MSMKELPKEGTKEYALADALSRSNAINGVYTKLKFPLDWEDLNKKDAIHITYLVDVADRIIKEAVDGGKDLGDHKIQEELKAAIYGHVAGASFGIIYHRFLCSLGLRK